MATDGPPSDDPPTDGPEPEPAVPHPAFEPYVGEPVPQAAPGSPGKDGRLELSFERGRDGGTDLTWDFARAPFHVSGTLDHDPIEEAATVYVQSPTGGIAQGDRRSVAVEVGPDAIARVGTGSATKVFSMECNYARSEVSLSVGAGGHLEYVPEPTILHPDSRFCQSVTLEVADGASAVVGDIVVPGRLARGEAFDFERYYGHTEVVDGDGRLLAADTVHLDPAEDSPRVPGVLGEFAVVGTMFVVAPAAETDALADAIHERVVRADGTEDGNEDSDEDGAEDGNEDSDEDGDEDDDDAGHTAGATALPNGAGVLVRAVGETTPPVRAALRRGWDGARNSLLDAPAPPRRT